MEQRYRTMEDQKTRPGLARIQDFAQGEGFEPKPKILNQNLKRFALAIFVLS